MITLIFLLTVLFYLYKFSRLNFDFWDKLNVPFIKPLPFVGNVGPVIMFKKQIAVFLGDIYRAHSDKRYIGIFFGNKPCLVVNDLEMAEDMLNKNFYSFSKRIFSPHEQVDPMGARSLFAFKDDMWKTARSKLSAGFTSQKLKNIFNDLHSVSDKFSTKVKSDGMIMDVNDMAVRYMLDGIANGIFHLSGKAIEDPIGEPMWHVNKKMTSGSLFQSIKNVLIFITPQLLAHLRIQVFSPSVTDYMRSKMKEIAEDRSRKEIKRDDFMDVLLEQRKNGGWRLKNGQIFELEGDNLAAQIFMFMTAGVETTASAIIFTCYELARNQDVQAKVRSEINEIIGANDGVVSYECLKDMKYLGMAIDEALRMYSPFAFLDKICTIDYTIPGTNTIIPKGTFVMIPMEGFHMDEKYWPEPLKYDPERFVDLQDIQKRAYFPFGHSFRKCLGKNLAQIQIKLALIAIIKDYKMTTNANNVVPDPGRFNTMPKEKIYINLSPLS